MDIGTPRLGTSPEDQKMRATVLALTSSDSTYTQKEGLSNLDKLGVVREILHCPTCDIFADFPYQELYDTGSPESFHAAYYLCDLRMQALDRLIEEAYGDLVDHFQRRLINVSWKVRFRERINLHNTSVTLHEHRPSSAVN